MRKRKQDGVMEERRTKHKEQKKQCPGKVWLVGAGPGAADLLTVKARRLFEDCDCIVYDRLVGEEVLSQIPPGRELIHVGKVTGHHSIPQEEINGILVREARLGKRVVRLKGGDPFLFGRGGEEAEVLEKEGIAFEIVPGISSAFAFPAYQGIPVTHRDYVSGVHIFTGHGKECKDGKDSRPVPYKALVQAGGTLVFLMGVHALEELMEGLCLAGIDKDMPAAILQQGTTAGQKKVVATVADLAAKAKKEKIKPPSVIIVGEVCRLHETLSWYEKLPLAGEKILVTRPLERGKELQEELRALGAEVWSVPAIETLPAEDKALRLLVETELARLNTYQVLVFTSPYGVECFFSLLLKSGRDVRDTAHMKFAVIGQGTADALLKKGIRADYMPEQYDSISLGRLLAEKLRAGTRILLARSAIGSEELLQELKKNPGLSCTDLAIYTTKFALENTALMQSLMRVKQDERLPKIVFTSSSTVEGFCRMLGCAYPYEMLYAVCIGEKTRQAAARMGMHTSVAQNATVSDLICCFRQKSWDAYSSVVTKK